MALSKQAEALKNRLQAVVADMRELEAVEAEWRDWLYREEEYEPSGEEDVCTLTVFEELYAERKALQKQVAKRQLQNWVVLQYARVNGLQRRILRLRYIQGRSWGDIIEAVGKSKQYLLREHNKALEALCRQLPKR